MAFYSQQLGKETNMDFIINKKEISEKDKARPPKRSEEVLAERSNDNGQSTAT